MKNPIQSMTSDESKILSVLDQKVIYFPEGVPAFEGVKNFLLIAKDEDLPFLWLQAVDVPHLSFVVIDPFLVSSEYQPEVLDEDIDLLQIKHPEDAIIVSIVNLKNVKESGVTTNLVGPILINWKMKCAKQVILKNHMDYSVKYRINPS